MKHMPIEKALEMYNIFLTHTVQMKQYFELKLDEDFTLLLNPHGSDETLFIFISSALSLYFLTHTVQMKPSGKNGYAWWGVSLLNPHGSDETAILSANVPFYIASS